MTRPDATIELRDYVRVLKARRVTILVATLLGLTVAMAFTTLATPEYHAEAKVLVLPLANPLTTSASALQAFEPDMNTENEVVRSAAVASLARQALGVTTSTQSLLKPLSVDVVLDSDVIIVGYSDPDPNRAARLANAFAQGYLRYRSGIIAGQLQQAVDSLRERIRQTSAALTRVQTELARSHDLTDIRRQLLKMQQLQFSTTLSSQAAKLSDVQTTIDSSTGGKVVESAVPPAEQSSPRVSMAVALGLVGGLILGVAAAFLRESLDDHITDPQEVEQILGAPVIGSIERSPREDGRKPTLVTRVDPRGSAAEAYRVIGTRIQHLYSGVRPLVLLMTSATPGGGTSTSVANLGVVLAQAGDHVLLLSADFRSPRLHRFFQLPNEPGLSKALTDSIDPHSLMRSTKIANLSILSAGRAPTNPSLLGGERMRQTLGWIREEDVDVVLIDSPAALVGSDASSLGALADGTILICDARSITAHDLERSRQQLETSGARISAAINTFDRAGTFPYSVFAQNGHPVRT